MATVNELNCTAVSLLQQGNFDGALSKYQRALELARNRCSNDNDQQSMAGPYTVQIVRFCENMHFQPNLMKNSSDVFLSNDFEVFQAAFRVRRPQENQQQSFIAASEHGHEDEVLQDIEVLMLLYNFGFTLHLKGLVSSDASHRESALRKALQVYQMANTCARSIALRDHPELYTLLLALAVNQGFVHSFFFHQDEVQNLHDKIVSFLTATNEAAVSLLGQDYFFFEGVAVCSGFAKTKLPPMA